jgi:hypothetical protein
MAASSFDSYAQEAEGLLVRRTYDVGLLRRARRASFVSEFDLDFHRWQVRLTLGRVEKTVVGTVWLRPDSLPRRVASVAARLDSDGWVRVHRAILDEPGDCAALLAMAAAELRNRSDVNRYLRASV